MNKIIDKIIISADGINVISKTNGIKGIVQLNLNGNSEILREIFEKNNLSEITNYKYNERIAVALGENGEQLRSYLEICRQVNNGNKINEKAENIPQIEYELKELKKNEQLTVEEKISLYEQAKDVHNTLKKAKQKVSINMGLVDRAYFEIQKLLQNKDKVKALNPGSNKIQEVTTKTHADFVNEIQYDVSEEKALENLIEKEELEKEEIVK